MTFPHLIVSCVQSYLLVPATSCQRKTKKVMVVVEWQVGFEELEKFALSNPEPASTLGSGRQELAEIYLDMALK